MYRNKVDDIMDVIVGKRGSGKTTQLLNECMKTDDKILLITSNKDDIDILSSEYNEQSKNVRFMSYYDVKKHKYIGERFDKIFIDDVIVFLRGLIRLDTPIEKITVTGECKELEGGIDEAKVL